MSWARPRAAAKISNVLAGTFFLSKNIILINILTTKTFYPLPNQCFCMILFARVLQVEKSTMAHIEEFLGREILYF